jgi:multiple sugar transport system permease protein
MRTASGLLLVLIALAALFMNVGVRRGVPGAEQAIGAVRSYEPTWMTLVRAGGVVALFAWGMSLIGRARGGADRAATSPLRYAALGTLAALYVVPIAWMVTTSLKPERETRKTVVPAAVRPANYGDAMAFEHGRTDVFFREDPAWVRAIGNDTIRDWTSRAVLAWSTPFATQLSNTLTVGLLGTFGVVFSSSLAAYAFARLKWPGRDLFFLLTVTTMMVPFAVKIVPLYGLFREIGWVGTLKPLWAPAFFGTGFSIFLLRQFFKGIPQDLTDAARMDGCSEFGIYLRVVLPLSKPALAAVALFHFLYVWNDFFAPLVFLTDPGDFTLALGLHQFQSTHGGGTPWNLMMAAATLVTLPVMFIFFFSQRYFVRGITMSGLKG